MSLAMHAGGPLSRKGFPETFEREWEGEGVGGWMIGRTRCNDEAELVGI